jgi:aminoglycoside 3-N-acetyltransferase
MKETWKRLNSVRKAAGRTMMPAVTRAELLKGLQAARIEPGDTIVVHSSLSRIGEVEGGAPTVVSVLLEAVGPGGNIVMPAFTPADDYLAALADGQILDLRTSRSATGKITEAFRVSPGTLRSSHPFCSCVASGARARYIVGDHERDPHICHKDSPLGRMLELDAKIVGLGTNVDTVSFYHCVEDLWSEFPFEPCAPPFMGTYLDAEGREVRRELLRHNPELAKYRIDHPYGEWLRDQLHQYFADRGLLRPFTFGCAPSWVMNARELFEEMCSLARRGVTIYSRQSDEVAKVLGAARAPEMAR